MTTEERIKPMLNRSILGEIQKRLVEAELIANDLITSGTGYAEEIAYVVDIKRKVQAGLKILAKEFLV